MLTRAEFVARFPNVCLVAVSKLQPIEKIEALYREGHRDFGENYVQELLEKAQGAQERGLHEIRWHFVGHLQSNKAKKLAPLVTTIHSIDSFELGQKISDAAGPKKIEVFVQVNLDDEDSKSGVSVDDAPVLCQKISALPGVMLLGIMALPKPDRSPDEMLKAFEAVAALGTRCRPWTQGKLSMGTTEDFEWALQAGATHVRLGRALFGERSRF